MHLLHKHLEESLTEHGHDGVEREDDSEPVRFGRFDLICDLIRNYGRHELKETVVGDEEGVSDENVGGEGHHYETSAEQKGDYERNPF